MVYSGTKSWAQLDDVILYQLLTHQQQHRLPKRGKAQLMQAWIYSPLQRIASDSGIEGGREGIRRTGIGKKKKKKSKEQSLLGDNQTGCNVKADLRKLRKLS